jgi:hypothetical protein
MFEPCERTSHRKARAAIIPVERRFPPRAEDLVEPNPDARRRSLRHERQLSDAQRATLASRVRTTVRDLYAGPMTRWNESSPIFFE